MYGTITLYGEPSQALPLTTQFSYLTQVLAELGRITQNWMEPVLCNGHLCLTTPFKHSPASLFVCEQTKD